MDDQVYGINAVMQLLEESPDSIARILVAKGRSDRRLQQLQERARAQRVRLQSVERDELDERTQQARHQGVLAYCRGVELWDEARLVQHLAALDHPPLLLALDSVQDPHNLGACLRSADAAGVDAVLIPKDRAVGVTPVVRKVASGAVETVPLVQVVNLARAIDRLKQEQGIWVVGAAGETETSVFDLDLKGPLMIVMGSEGKGLRRLVREQCDFLARIPMQGRVESLNVSVATGVCLFEALRQRVH